MKRFSILVLLISALFVYTTAVEAGCLRVLSPNGGESWEKGSTQTIRWSNTCGKNVKIILRKDGSKFGTIATNIPSTTTSYSWNVGQTLNGSAPTGSNYKILMKTMDNSDRDASDATFSITSSSSTQPRIPPLKAYRKFVPPNDPVTRKPIQPEPDPVPPTGLKQPGPEQQIQQPAVK